jgi:hypothetical protein
VRRLKHAISALLPAAACALSLPASAEPAIGWTESGAARPRPRERGVYAEPFATLSFGRGVRFNNPFRLETQLGDDAESLSLTASYLDLGLGAAFGDPNGFRHGAVLHFSLALEGVTQEVITPSYLLVHPLLPDVTGYARAGTPIVLEPDLGFGVELGAGAVWFLSAGAGLTAELVGSVFFGAATWERDPSVIPIASLQLGAWVEYEVLP